MYGGFDERLARASSRPEALLRQLTRQQAEAQAELEHIVEAIRQGILTPTTWAMREDAERRVSTLGQAIAEVRQRPAPIVSAASSIDRYVTDLRATLATNPDKARRLLALGVRRIVLRWHGSRLWADLEGDLAGVLGIDDSTMAPKSLAIMVPGGGF